MRTDSAAGGLTVLLSAVLVGVAIGILGTIQMQGLGSPVVMAPGTGDAAAAVSPGGNERGGDNADLARVEAALAALRRSTLAVCRIQAGPLGDARAADDGPDRRDLPAAPPAVPNLREPVSVSRASDMSSPARRIDRARPSDGSGQDARPPNGLEHRDGGTVTSRSGAAAEVPRRRPGAADDRRCPPGGRSSDGRLAAGPAS